MRVWSSRLQGHIDSPFDIQSLEMGMKVYIIYNFQILCIHEGTITTTIIIIIQRKIDDDPVMHCNPKKRDL